MDIIYWKINLEYLFNLRIHFFLILIATLLLATTAVSAQPEIMLSHTGLSADELSIIINDDDAQSTKVGEYYQKVRHIPAANVIHVHFQPGHNMMTKDDFRGLKNQIDQATPAHIQAYAITWTQPYRVDCMSITSALTFGFDEKYCSANCGTTQASPYFNSASLYPEKDFKMRPSMMLAGTSFEQVKSLIDRGVASDHRYPSGRAYLLTTPDASRSVRSANFTQTAKALKGVIPVVTLKANAISRRKDVLFYFTGLPQVPFLETLRFVPGALADHLTSLGGQLTDSSQMSVLRWLEAGATASYGTVVEPCNHPQKFPYPGIAMFYYANGASAIEAYWKSVAWPGEGLFVGEPLAKPFAPLVREFAPGQFELSIFSAQGGQLRVEASSSSTGPFSPVAKMAIQRGLNIHKFSVPESTEGFLRLQW